MNETPIAQALVICDTIIEEARTSKKTLVGTFNGIQAQKFPVQHPKMSVYASLTNGRGTVNITMRLQCITTGKEVLKVGGPMVFPDVNAVVEMVIHLNGVPFETPGLYAFELLGEGTHLLEKRFNVMQAQPKPPTTGAK